MKSGKLRKRKANKMKFKYSDELVIGTENDGSPITLKAYQNELLKILGDVLEVLDREHITYFIDGGTLLGAVRHHDIIPWDDDIDICFFLKDYDRLLAALDQVKPERYCVQCFDRDSQYDVTQPMIKLRKKNTYVEYDAVYARNNCEEKGIFIDFIAVAPVPEGKQSNFWWRKGAFLRSLVLLALNKMGINLLWLKRYHMKKANDFARKAAGSPLLGYAISHVAWQNHIWKRSDILPFKKVKYHTFFLPAPQHADVYLKELYGDYMKYPDLHEVELLHSKNLKLKSGMVKGGKHGN